MLLRFGLLAVLIVLLAFAVTNSGIWKAESPNSKSRSDFGAGSSVPMGYDLVWADEFDGTSLDRDKWAGRGSGKRREGYLDVDFAKLDGKGHLVITTIIRDGEAYSAMIGTESRYHVTFGYIEARLKFPRAQGLLSAIWLQSPGNTRGELPPETAGVEIDIAEVYAGRLGRWLLNSIHWGGYQESHQQKQHRQRISSTDDWYVVGLRWSESEMVFSVNGETTWVVQEPISRVPQYLILSTVVIKNFAGREDGVVDQFVVDYIRVYQRKVPAEVREGVGVAAS